ncbi:MAG: hypothetical protein HY425_01115 [Candidatus Levybacteria bacterium]|nr:hypothetical protein [Candidatus Levybacteria bacterium]
MKSAKIRHMLYLALLFFEIAVLFLLSREVSKTLSKFMSIIFLSFLFLPGVIIHELSHMLMAVMLFVGVGSMEFSPKISPNGVKLGSIEIAKTDPMRRSMIGFAPVLFGMTLILGLIYLSTDSGFVTQAIELNGLFGVGIAGLVFYLLFAISNTMFSSKKDMEGTLEILITLLIIFIAVYVLGFRPPVDFVEKIFTKEIVEIVRKSSLFLLAPIAIDMLILGTIGLFTYTRSRKF